VEFDFRLVNLVDLLNCLNCYCNYIFDNCATENYIFDSNDFDVYFSNPFGYLDVSVYNCQKVLRPNDLKSLLLLLN